MLNNIQKMQYSPINSSFQNKKRTPELSSANKSNLIKKNENLYTLSFSGNPHQILLISLECRPFAKTGGMADVNSEFPGVYNSVYKEKDEIRVMIPLFNAPEGPSTENNKLYFTNHNGVKFPLEKTGIETEFTYGANTSKAVLYKSQNPENQVTTYFVYSPIISKDVKEYTQPYSNMYETNSAFSAACVALISKLKEKENFDPGFLHTTDWHTAFAIHDLHEYQKKNHLHYDIKTVHTFHNAGYGYQGAQQPIQAALINFNSQEILKLINNKEITTEFSKLGIKNSPQEIKSYLNDPEKFNSPNAKLSLKKINNKVIELFPDKPWDERGNYNPSLRAIKEADLLTLVSSGFMKETIKHFSLAPVIQPYLKEKAKEGKLVGIVNGLVSGDFDSKKAKFPYDITNFETEKIKNKIYLQEQLSLNGDKEIIKNGTQAKVEGYLDVNPDAMVCFMASRFDTNQKGIDIAMKAAEKILEKNKNIQLIIGGAANCPEKSELVDNFRKNVIDKYPGRAIFIKEWLTMPQFMAGADAFMVPSRWEPCGLTQLQAMKMGVIPIVSNTGGLMDTVTSCNQNSNKATGFKTAKSLLFEEKPEEEFAKVVEQAYNVFENRKTDDIWNKMIKNSLNYNSSWNKSVIRYHNNVYNLGNK
ncbi:MAG TPA: glycogen/starch synthase [Candidatus Gastranaerophilales bacterium]|nr:glycogen/starch synthase [Candidatus Gastranaerophilales bacterium]